MNKQLTILLMLLVPLMTSGQTNHNIEQKMREIIIPSIEFREANPIDVMNFLADASVAVDPAIPFLGLVSTNALAKREFFTYESEDGSPLILKPLTLEYQRISLADAYDRITKKIGITYRIENGRLEFFTQDGKRIVQKKHVD